MDHAECEQSGCARKLIPGTYFPGDADHYCPRHDAYYRSGGETRMDKATKRLQSVLELKEKGFTPNQIESQVGLDRSTVRKMIARALRPRLHRYNCECVDCHLTRLKKESVNRGRKARKQPV